MKGKITPRTHSIATSLNSRQAEDDEFKSCNGDAPTVDKETVESAKKHSPVTLNRTWGAPSKCIALLQPHRDNSTVSRPERVAIALRASKKADILRSKRNRGESLASASNQLEREVPHNDI